MACHDASNLWGLSGSPMYLKGKVTSENLVSSRIACLRCSPTPPKKMEDFAALTTNPDIPPKPIVVEIEFQWRTYHLCKVEGCRLWKPNGIYATLGGNKNYPFALSNPSNISLKIIIIIIIQVNLDEIYLSHPSNVDLKIISK